MKKVCQCFLSKKFCMGYSVICGGLIAGLLYSIGETSGEYHGTVEANNRWKNAIDKIFEKSDNDCS